MKSTYIKIQILTLFIGFFCISSITIADNDNFKTVNNVDFVAEFSDSKISGQYGVLVLGGSGGGIPKDLANKIASMGYPVLSLAYFKEPTLPQELEMIPLEYFEAPKQWLMQHESTRNDGLIVVGWSKGAELALILASTDRDYKGVVGIAPSSVTWAGILKDWTKVPSSSWSLNDQPMAYVPFASGVQISELVDLYQASLKNTDAVHKALIPVEQINGPSLLLTGGQDSIWPANEMAKTVCDRINHSQKQRTCQHINYQHAGHLLDENIIIGGTFESNAQANQDSRKKIKDFLYQTNNNKNQ